MRLSGDLFWILQNITTVVVIKFRGLSCVWENVEMLIVIDILYVLSCYVDDMGDSIYQELEKTWSKWSGVTLLNYHDFFHLWLIWYFNWTIIYPVK